jgi:selenide,water dikinase
LTTQGSNNSPGWIFNDQKMTRQKHLVLVGGGHAHAQVIKALNKASRPKDMKVTLIDIETSASYSGMVPGCIAGSYTAEDTLLHLTPLSKWADMNFINDRVVDIDLDAKEIFLKGSDISVPFDAVSLDIGSTSRGLLTTKGVVEYTIPTRPISDLVKRFDKETEALEANRQSTVNVVVIGGGPAGIELSMSVMGRWKAILGKDKIRVILLDSGSQLVPSETAANQDALVRAVTDHGIEILHNSHVEEVLKSAVRLTNGEEIPYTHCLWATGAESQKLNSSLKDRGLAVSDRGYIRVNQYLQSVSHPYIFAAGDCNTVEGRSKASPPKAGVYAVRSGPVLTENLTRFLTNEQQESWKAYDPQDDFLKLIGCGDGTAVGFRFGFPMQGKWVFQLKDAIDRSFVDLFKVENLPELVEGQPYDTAQFDATGERRPPIEPSEAATLLKRTDDDVDFREAWDVLRDMAADDDYRESVIRLMPPLGNALLE